MIWLWADPAHTNPCPDRSQPNSDGKRTRTGAVTVQWLAAPGAQESTAQKRGPSVVQCRETAGDGRGCLADSMRCYWSDSDSTSRGGIVDGSIGTQRVCRGERMGHDMGRRRGRSLLHRMAASRLTRLIFRHLHAFCWWPPSGCPSPRRRASLSQPRLRASCDIAIVCNIELGYWTNMHRYQIIPHSLRTRRQGINLPSG